jgi:hypothetical protein
MGTICNMCRKKGYQKVNYLAPEEKEITFKDYSSPNDEPLSVIETTHNFFSFVQLVEYINLLEQFTIESSTIPSDAEMRTKFSSKDEFLNQEISTDEFQSFIENKIFTLSDLYELTGNNQKIASIFKQICIEIYRSLDLKLRQHYNNDDSPIIIKKKNLLPLGILFCTCNNVEKIKFVFDIFKNENEEICKSKELNDYLLSLFLTGSYCLISARNKIGNNNVEIDKIPKDVLLKLVNVSELKDCENLVDYFNNNFFIKESYNWEDFKGKFEDLENGFGWIFSSKGIRRHLEDNNV